MSEPSGERQSEARQAAEEYERSKAELDAAIREHKKATEAQRHAYMATEDHWFFGDFPDNYQDKTPELEQYRREQRERRQPADEAVRAAQERVDELWTRHKGIEREYLRSTVEPRVEGSKLRHEEYKLRATLSSASVVGIAATSGLLLPSDRYYTWLLVLSFSALFVSIVLNLRSMQDVSDYVEGTLITGEEVRSVGIKLWLTHNTLTVGLIFFAIFMVLNLLS